MDREQEREERERRERETVRERKCVLMEAAKKIKR